MGTVKNCVAVNKETYPAAACEPLCDLATIEEGELEPAVQRGSAGAKTLPGPQRKPSEAVFVGSGGTAE